MKTMISKIKNSKWFIGASLAVMGGLVPTSMALAQAVPPDCGQGFRRDSTGACVPSQAETPTRNIFSGAESFSDIVFTLLNYAFAIAGIVAVVFILVGGFKYLTAGGDEEATKKARTYIVNALIGLVIVLTAMVLVRIVSNLIGGTQGV